MYQNTFNDVYFPCVKSYTKKIDIRLIPMKLRTYKIMYYKVVCHYNQYTKFDFKCNSLLINVNKCNEVFKKMNLYLCITPIQVNPEKECLITTQ